MKKITVLVVEDEKVLQDAYKLILTTYGFEVFTADNGADALTRLKTCKPHVMLLDLFMPIMDGQEVLRTLDRKEFPHMKIIVYSNLSNDGVQNDVLKYGADKFVLKSSLSPGELVAMIEATV
jgi:DNA-binding response OmpR family regulator